ncbi:MAG: PilZ domain-containing protein, partial [Planctomycetota bacterium]|nr:PilZ domain-containing protein [Planctomycetota bacterium]
MNQSDTILAMARRIGKGMYRRRSRTERRKSGRLNQETVACNLGSVINLSAGGMGLLSRRRLNGTLSIELWDTRRGLRLRGKVAWFRRIGFLKHEFCVKFLNITPDIA